MVTMPIVTGEIYHIYNKSIAEFVIFNNDDEFLRMKELIRYYQVEQLVKFSEFKELKSGMLKEYNGEKLIEIICYCLMPTHLHLVVKQLKENGVLNFMRNLSNSYSHYFNIKHNRKGPLWEGRFKKVLVKADEQLLHLTRYVHLNPVTAYLVNDPIEWKWSSYREYIYENNEDTICEYDKILDINMNSYKSFVEDRISYQRELAKIKGLMID